MCALVLVDVDTASRVTASPDNTDYLRLGPGLRRVGPDAGTAIGITPTHRYGAIELVARYSHIDLKDGAMDGGELDKMHFGLNWWASRQWKVGVSYGDADRDRDDVRGNTRMLLCRLQWYY